MTALDDVKPGATIRGVVPGHSVALDDVKPGATDRSGSFRSTGSATRQSTWSIASRICPGLPVGGVSETTLYRDDENRLGKIEARGRSWSFDGDANLLRLVRSGDDRP